MAVTEAGEPHGTSWAELERQTANLAAKLGIRPATVRDRLRALVARGLVDPKRVGVYGWSYGGYMSLIDRKSVV